MFRDLNAVLVPFKQQYAWGFGCFKRTDNIFYVTVFIRNSPSVFEEFVFSISKVNICLSLLQTIARQLAEILLRGMCEQSYWNPLEDPPHQSPLDDPLRKGSNTKNYALSRRPRVYTGEKYD